MLRDAIDGSTIEMPEDYFAPSLARLVTIEFQGQTVYDFEDGWVADKLAH